MQLIRIINDFDVRIYTSVETNQYDSWMQQHNN